MRPQIVFFFVMVFLLGWAGADGSAQQKLTQPGLEIEVIETPGKLPPLPQAPQIGDPARGAALYKNCVSCHGSQGRGVAGQTEGQLMAAMQNYQTGSYTNRHVVKMQRVLRTLSQDQLADLAAYISKM